MRSVTCPLPLTLCLFTTVASAQDPDPLRDISITVDALEYTSQRFDMGVINSHWSSGNRYELVILSQPTMSRVEPSGGGYAFWEEREWRGQSRSSADYSCWGFGLQGGATLQLLPPERKLMLALVPQLRGGLGFQDLRVTNVPITAAGSTQTYDLSSNAGRVEVAAGLDLRMTVANRVEFVFGCGADYWSSASVYVTAGTAGAAAGVVGSSYAFHGSDCFLRFGIGARL
jgi:hypothetical protein